MLELGARDPMAALTAETSQDPAAIQNGFALAVEALSWLRADRLRSVDSILEAERRTGAGQIDHRLNQGIGVNCDRVGRPGGAVDSGTSHATSNQRAAESQSAGQD